MQIANALKANPDDPQALASLGEVKLDQGALAEAVELFRRSYGLRPDEATRGQLVESLLEALSADFAANRGSLDELDKLIDQPRAPARRSGGSRPLGCRPPASWARRSKPT